LIASHDAFDDLPRITCPTHITAGSRDFCAPPYLSRELVDVIAGARLTLLDGGHFIFLEQPNLFYRSVSAFLVA
jgi:aminoacrylate hydrolase